MAQPFEQTQARTPLQPQAESAVHFKFNEKDPTKSQLCDDTRGTCRLASPADFHAEYPNEYADFVKHHPELQERMRQFDAKNPAILGLPKLRYVDELTGGDNNPTRSKVKNVPSGADGHLDADPSRRQLRLDPSGRGLKLDPSGRIQLDPAGHLQFDSAPKLQLDSSGRLQLRLNGNDRLGYGADGADPANFSDPSGRYGSSLRRNNGFDALLDPLGQGRRNNGLDALLGPFGQGRNGLDALLDPMGRRRGNDPYGYDSLYNNPNSRYRFPGQGRYGNDGPLDLGPAENLQLLYQPRAVEKPVVQPKPAEPPKPSERLQPVEQPKPIEPAKPIDGPKPPQELETRPQVKDTPAVATDQSEVKDAFDQAVKDTGAFTIKNFGDAYREAAKAGAGVAIMVVGRDIDGSLEALKNVKKLQEENPNLRFLVVDRDKVDAAVKADPNNSKMKEWQNWIDTSLKACSNGEQNAGVLTSVQSLKADSTGYPAPEKVTSYHWNNNINQELNAKASLASDATVAHAGEFRLTMNAESARALASEIATARQQAFDAPVTDLNSVKTRQERFTRALQLAAQARPDLLAQRRKEIDAIQDEATRQQELSIYNQLQNAPLQLRAELGLEMARSVADMPTPEKKAAMSAAGLEVLRDAYRSAPELKNNAQFADALKLAGVNVDQLIKESETAPPVTADQIKEKLEKVYTAGDPVRVTEKRTEYRANVSQETRGVVSNPQYRRGCYSQNCIRQRCCTPGGICRNFCGCGN